MNVSRLLLPCYRKILKTNLILSVVLSLLSLLAMPDFSKYTPLHFFLLCFIVWILTGGFMLTAYYFELTGKNEIYFYYNLNLSRLKRIGIAYLMHVIIAIPLLIILYYV